jgi:hypothetical protein
MQSIPNMITAATNIFAVIPAAIAYSANDTVTSACVACAGFFSTISHLFESHKHGLHGFGMSPNFSWWLNKLDIGGVVVLSFRIIWILCLRKSFCTEFMRLLFPLMSLLICNLISEHDTSPRTTFRYLLFHNAWHMGIFVTLGNLLNSIYK